MEVLPDEQKATSIGFLTRAVGWFNEQGITWRRVLSDNGSSYRSGEWRKSRSALDLSPIRTKSYTPRTNGKAKRFTKTLLGEWAYAVAFQTSEERSRWLPRYLGAPKRAHVPHGSRWPQPTAVPPTPADG